MRIWESLRLCLSSLHFTFFFFFKVHTDFWRGIQSWLFSQAAEPANQCFFSSGLVRRKGEAGTGSWKTTQQLRGWGFGYLFIKTAVAWPFSAVSALFIMPKSKCAFLYYLKKENIRVPYKQRNGGFFLGGGETSTRTHWKETSRYNSHMFDL